MMEMDKAWYMSRPSDRRRGYKNPTILFKKICTCISKLTHKERRLALYVLAYVSVNKNGDVKIIPYADVAVGTAINFMIEFLSN